MASVFYFLLFLSSLFFTGAAISVAYQLFPPFGSLSALWSNLLFGGFSGSLLATGLHLIWKRLSPSFEEEGIEQRLLNSLWVGLGGTVVGVIIAYSIALTFPASNGVRIAQGALLVGCSLIGIRI